MRLSKPTPKKRRERDIYSIPSSSESRTSTPSEGQLITRLPTPDLTPERRQHSIELGEVGTTNLPADDHSLPDGDTIVVIAPRPPQRAVPRYPTLREAADGLKRKRKSTVPTNSSPNSRSKRTKRTRDFFRPASDTSSTSRTTRLSQKLGSPILDRVPRIAKTTTISRAFNDAASREASIPETELSAESPGSNLARSFELGSPIMDMRPSIAETEIAENEVSLETPANNEERQGSIPETEGLIEAKADISLQVVQSTATAAAAHRSTTPITIASTPPASPANLKHSPASPPPIKPFAFDITLVPFHFISSTNTTTRTYPFRTFKDSVKRLFNVADGARIINCDMEKLTVTIVGGIKREIDEAGRKGAGARREMDVLREFDEDFEEMKKTMEETRAERVEVKRGIKNKV